MATNPQGNTPEIRSNSNQLIHADGTTGTIAWVRQDSLIKRLRRHLAKKNHRLLITSECDPALAEYGQYAVLDADGHPLQTHANLPALARFLGQLADDEMIEPPAEVGWLYHLAREHVEVIDGKRVRLRDRLTQDFKTEKAARKAVAKIEDRAGLVVVGMDADDALAMRFEEEQQARQTEALAEIETAIEANPVLRHLRSEAGCPITWGRAVEIDRQLQEDRVWAGKPVAERFAEVTKRLVGAGMVSGVSV